MEVAEAIQHLRTEEIKGQIIQLVYTGQSEIAWDIVSTCYKLHSHDDRHSARLHDLMLLYKEEARKRILGITRERAIGLEKALLGESGHPVSSDCVLYLDIPGGRLNHSISLTIKMIAYVTRAGWTPRLFKLYHPAFGRELSELYLSKAESRDIAPSNYLAISDHKIYTSRTFRDYMSEIRLSRAEVASAQELLSNELDVIRQHLSHPSPSLLQALDFVTSEALQRKKLLSVHLRRGDLGVLNRDDFADTVIYGLFEGDVLCFAPEPISEVTFQGGRDRSLQWLSQEQFLILCREKIGRVGSRIQNQKSLQYYHRKISEIVKGERSQWVVSVFTDGYTRHAKHIAAGSTGMEASEIESIINYVQFKSLLDLGAQVFAGEPHQLVGFVDVLGFAMIADSVVAEESLFPSSFLRLFRELD